ncbi:hypothetical protein H696_01611 [Fonticula alba]|uniref:Uncharacterized protein n=1 Tax=Fonticula alba TaxID=691883 RepID=A0A058ZE34_FONAL|nr:hypothetical protein H696_01611 [Fonticula alba]KCV72211.1 hypothetical protein H696_01611 [Fonticula alba]|eukprot:XP_009493789.1 hypothetical protein H696_01611 [Fonticula alba]
MATSLAGLATTTADKARIDMDQMRGALLRAATSLSNASLLLARLDGAAFPERPRLSHFQQALFRQISHLPATDQDAQAAGQLLDLVGASIAGTSPADRLFYQSTGYEESRSPLYAETLASRHAWGHTTHTSDITASAHSDGLFQARYTSGEDSVLLGLRAESAEHDCPAAEGCVCGRLGPASVCPTESTDILLLRPEQLGPDTALPEHRSRYSRFGWPLALSQQAGGYLQKSTEGAAEARQLLEQLRLSSDRLAKVARFVGDRVDPADLPSVYQGGLMLRLSEVLLNSIGRAASRASEDGAPASGADGLPPDGVEVLLQREAQALAAAALALDSESGLFANALIDAHSGSAEARALWHDWRTLGALLE